MADTIRDVVIRVSLDQVEPDTTEFKAAFSELSTASERAATSSTEELEKIEDAVQDLSDELDEAKKKMEETAQQLTDDSIKAAEGFKTAGDGAFTLARGIALVGVSSEEDLAKVTEQIAKIQGSFDIFRGGIDTIKGLVEGTRALKAATGAATVAEAGLAVANTAVATTGKAAAASMAALHVAMGPIGLALLGISAAVGAIATVWVFWDDADEPIKDTAQALNAANVAAEKFSETTKNLGDDLERIAPTGEVNRILEERISLEEEGLSIAERTGNARERSQERINQLTDKGAQIEKQFTDAILSQRLDQEDSIAKIRELTIQKDAAAAEIAARIQEEKVALQKNELDLQKEQAQQSERELQADRQKLQTAKDLLAQEQGRLQTAKERFGALSEEQQLAVSRAARKAQGGGQLSREEESLLEQFAPETVSRSRTERAEQSGLFGDVAGLELGGAVESAQSRVDTLKESLGDIVGSDQEFNQTLKDLAMESKNAQIAGLQLLEQLVADQRELRNRQQEISSDLQTARLNQNA